MPPPCLRPGRWIGLGGTCGTWKSMLYVPDTILIDGRSGAPHSRVYESSLSRRSVVCGGAAGVPKARPVGGAFLGLSGAPPITPPERPGAANVLASPAGLVVGLAGGIGLLIGDPGSIFSRAGTEVRSASFARFARFAALRNGGGTGALRRGGAIGWRHASSASVLQIPAGSSSRVRVRDDTKAARSRTKDADGLQGSFTGVDPLAAWLAWLVVCRRSRGAPAQFGIYPRSAKHE
mmetsp:Transcript_60009/g.165049  ORF Transcript_60009/g.165049 Transcript_60009/m.165049 type:complete len:235 (-) Transcript_60009:119-823(-)